MDVSASAGFRQRPGWLMLVALLLVGQGWLTFHLFSPGYSLTPLLDERPLLSGNHPLHYYHGYLGAKTWAERGTSCCFDPAYQAGYPKTPVFDGGSRPAELFQIVGGQKLAAYKIGLALSCLLVPLAFIVMARGAGLAADAACVSGVLGCVIWWSEPCQTLFRAGNVDLLFGGLCVLLHVTWFVRFERNPSLGSWALLTAFAAISWFTKPLLVVGFLPFLLIYYVWVATRQGLIWHLSIAAAAVVAFGVNAGWLIDWARHLWLYLPFGGDLPAPAPFWPTLTQKWRQFLPYDPLIIGIAAAGLLGLLTMLKNNRSAAWVLGLGAVEFVLADFASHFWPVLAELGAENAMLLAAWCLVLPAAQLLSGIANYLATESVWRPIGAIALCTGLGVIGLLIDWPARPMRYAPLEIGLSTDRQHIVDTLTEQTRTDARILWEDRPQQDWSALLAALTQRSFLGGLDPDGRLEHMYARLAEGKLCGRPLASWSESQLREFVERYNVGWVVAWTPESIRRWEVVPFARVVAELTDGTRGVLFRLDRRPSFFLKGKGEWAQADFNRIALAEVVPVDGEVILSMHYQSRMRISPGYLQIERDIDLDDPIPFIRLRVPGPVARVSIVWDNP